MSSKRYAAAVAYSSGEPLLIGVATRELPASGSAYRSSPYRNPPRACVQACQRDGRDLAAGEIHGSRRRHQDPYDFSKIGPGAWHLTSPESAGEHLCTSPHRRAWSGVFFNDLITRRTSRIDARLTPTAERGRPPQAMRGSASGGSGETAHLGSTARTFRRRDDRDRHAPSRAWPFRDATARCELHRLPL